MTNPLTIRPQKYTINRKIIPRLKPKMSSKGPLTLIVENGLIMKKPNTIGKKNQIYISPIGDYTYYSEFYDNFIFIPDDHG